MENKMDIIFRKELSWEQKQTLAAKCFKNYCEKYNIRDETINKLLEHLYSMGKYKNEYNNLSIWERNGAKLELSGRGDPLPEKLEDKISKDKINEFNKILEYTVEVGMCDMYGKNTNKPYEYLMKCIKILENNTIELP
jgi:hypothetical protein